MAVYDAPLRAEDLLGWKSELGARVQDLLARRTGAARARLGAIVQRIEGAVTLAGLKSAVSDLVRHVRRTQAPGAASDLEALLSRISEHGRVETIENYSAYVFTVDLDL